MKLYFYDKKKDGIISKVIKMVTGEFNHVSIGYEYTEYISDIPVKKSSVFEALSGRFGQSGVFETNDADTFHKGKHAANIVEIDLGVMPKEVEARKFLENSVGSKYDFRWFVSFVFFWVRGKAKAYGCSELAFKAICIGYGIEAKNERVSPTQLYDFAMIYKAAKK